MNYDTCRHVVIRAAVHNGIHCSEPGVGGVVASAGITSSHELLRRAKDPSPILLFVAHALNVPPRLGVHNLRAVSSQKEIYQELTWARSLQSR